METNVALKLEETSGEFTLGIKCEQAIHFLKHYNKIMKKLKKEDTSEDVLNLFQLKHDLCEAYMKLFRALERLKALDKLKSNGLTLQEINHVLFVLTQEKI